jgi:hypothetical protein
VLAYVEPHVLSVTHYSPMMGQPDEPENYHTLLYVLTTSGDGTHLVLTQDGCDSEEQAAQFSDGLAGDAGRSTGARRALNPPLYSPDRPLG